MTHSSGQPEFLRPLGEQELEQVSGGMKSDPKHVSPNVIDARGGQFQMMWWTFTLDVNGKLSSMS